MEEACVLAWAAGPGGLALEPGAFPAEGISESRKEGSGEEEGWGVGERTGQAPAGTEFSLRLAKERGHLLWPG